MNKQLLLNGVLLLSMVGALLQAGEEHPAIAATSRLRATTHALKQAQERGAPPEDLAPLQAQLHTAEQDLDQYDINDDESDDSRSGSESECSSDDKDFASSSDSDSENSDPIDDNNNADGQNANRHEEQLEKAPHAGAISLRTIGITVGSVLFYRYVIAPRLAKRVRKMRKGRMRNILRMLTFSKKAA